MNAMDTYAVALERYCVVAGRPWTREARARFAELQRAQDALGMEPVDNPTVML